MQNSKNMRKRATAAVGVATAAALMVGSLAYFTDRVESQATTKAGTVGIREADTWTANLNDADGDRLLNNLNPGDSRSLAFSVTNTGNKAVDVRHSIQLSVLDSTGAPKKMSMRKDVATVAGDGSTPVEMLQFEIYKASDVVKTSEANGNKGYQLKQGAEPLFTTDSTSLNGTTMMGAKRDASRIDEGIVTYYFADSILDGIGAEAETGYAKAEHTGVDTTLAATDAVIGNDTIGDTVPTATNNKVSYDYVLIFRDTTLNDFQGSSIHLDLEVEAKQHLNTNSSWEHVETISTTLNASGKPTQDTTIDVAPDNNTGVLNDVTDTGAGAFNGMTVH